MSRTILDLGALPWQFGQAPRQPFSLQPEDDRRAVAEWLPARVPGDVRGDLLAVGRLASLDTPEGIAASEWVDGADWWYRTEIDGTEPGITPVLEADGIDYFSSVWLDGQHLASHQGMFARQAIVLPPSAQEHSKHELAVRVWGAAALPRIATSPMRSAVRKLLEILGRGTEYFPDRMATPKAQFSFGWDIAPRALSTGIWDEIRLVSTRGAYLSDVQIGTEPLTDLDPTPVRFRLRLRVSRFQPAPLHVRIELKSAAGQLVSLTQEAFDLPSAGDIDLAFDSSPVTRWWPWDQGDPHLYGVTVRLLDERGAVDEVEIPVGVRTVRRERFPNGQQWRFTVNGRHVFLRGANWVPVDILPGRVTAEDYSRLIGHARGAGINFLRVWGGGIREKRAFWEQCNTRGIMAMQEFPLACAFLDHYPRDQGYLSVLESEAEGIVRGLRNHPSLLAWCGGNEISPRRERLPLRTIRRVLEREDPVRPWVPASPSEGDIHQWDVWHGGAPWQSLSRVTAPFMSEFGLQALPQNETLAEMFPSGIPTSLDDPQWVARKAEAGKLRRYAGYFDERDPVATVVATQRAQAAGLQAGIEGCRLRREGSGHPHPCGGVAVWQLNEPWPAVSWSVIDRRGRLKAAYDAVHRAYQPLLIAARFDWRPRRPCDRFRAEIWLVNDAREQVEGCIVEAFLDGNRVYQCESAGTGEASARQIGALDVPAAEPPALLELICRQNGVVVARNEYDLGAYLPPRQPVILWLMRRVTDLLLRIG